MNRPWAWRPFWCENFSIIEEIKRRNTILLVEQNANMALSIANRAYVLGSRHIRGGKELALSGLRRPILGLEPEWPPLGRRLFCGGKQAWWAK